MSYDLIGDIHGCADTLRPLLVKLDYKEQDGVYCHPERRVIFLGDFIDRGSRQREVIGIVRRMVEAGSALAVMGNHEFNAIAYHTPDPEGGGLLRSHSEKNRKQHQAFLDAYEDDPQGRADAIRWFWTLPLWLDLGDLKIVHACWDNAAIESISNELGGGHHLDESMLVSASREGTWQYNAVETLLKGKEIQLRNGTSFHDKDSTERHHIRVRWWDRGATTYKEAFMGPESARKYVPDDEIHGDHLVEYSHDEPPVFLGHYWLEGDPEPLAPNIACLDFSVANTGGKLVAYRWSGERELRQENFVWVNRLEH